MLKIKLRFEIEIKQNMTFNKDEIDILTPNTKNHHYIIAKEDTILLDVFLPHYDNIKRICHYFDIINKENKLFLKNKI